MSKLDAIDRLIDFTETVKPYHTKIVEVLENYLYEEPVNTTITDVLLAISVDCVCDPDALHAGYGWDTQQWGRYHWTLLTPLDERGNFTYGVVEDDGNIMWGLPTEIPPDNPDECCTTCDIWLCEDVGWDTQPYGLYATVDAGFKDEKGNPVYDTANVDGNGMFDNPYACPDAEEE